MIQINVKSEAKYVAEKVENQEELNISIEKKQILMFLERVLNFFPFRFLQ
jgi:hypothetical protein